MSTSFRDVLRLKYMTDGKDVYGYYGDMTLANNLGLTTQVPCPLIVSNLAGEDRQEMDLNGFRFFLLRPRTTVTRDNWQILRFLDMVTIMQDYDENEYDADVTATLTALAKSDKLTREDIMQFVSCYPDITEQNLVERKMYDRLLMCLDELCEKAKQRKTYAEELNKLFWMTGMSYRRYLQKTPANMSEEESQAAMLKCDEIWDQMIRIGHKSYDIQLALIREWKKEMED